MQDFSRRDFVVSAGLATALGLSARLVVTPAFAQKTPDPAKGFATYKVGTVEVTAIYDGIWEKPHDPAFISNASVDDVRAAMTKAGLPADFVSIPFVVTVVKSGGKTILCDSGTGGQVQPTAGKMMTNMKAAGIDPGEDRHHPDLALSSRPHLRPDGQEQRAGVSQCRDRDLRCRVQVLDRPIGDRKAAGSQARPGEAHPGDVPDLEEHPPGDRRTRGRARHSLRRRARAYAGPSLVPADVGNGAVADLERHGLPAGAGGRQSGLAWRLRSGRSRWPKRHAVGCSIASSPTR